MSAERDLKPSLCLVRPDSSGVGDNNSLPVVPDVPPDFNCGNLTNVDDGNHIGGSRNTKRVTASSVRLFRAFLKEANNGRIDFEHFNEDILLNHLISFFKQVRKPDGDLYTKNGLLSIRFGLRRHLLDLHKVDVTRHPRLNSVFTAEINKLKQEGKGDIHHYPEISDEDMLKIYTSGVLSPDNPKGLLRKIFFETEMFFNRRSRDNLRDLKGRHFKVETDELGKKYLTTDFDRSFGCGPVKRIHATGTDICPVTAFQKFLLKRHNGCEALFQRPLNRVPISEKDSWFHCSALGLNKLANMMREISAEANLSKIYTNHSIRATSKSVFDLVWNGLLPQDSTSTSPGPNPGVSQAGDTPGPNPGVPQAGDAPGPNPGVLQAGDVTGPNPGVPQAGDAPGPNPGVLQAGDTIVPATGGTSQQSSTLTEDESKIDLKSGLNLFNIDGLQRVAEMADPPFTGDISTTVTDCGLYLTTPLNNEEIDVLLTRDSKSSQQAEKYAVLKFRHYLTKRGEPLSLENLSYHVTSGDMSAKERLLTYLTSFFGDLRRADGSKYKFNALRSIRYALNRFTLKFGVDFLNDAYLKKPLNDAWVALGECLKLEGKADVQHHDILSLEEVKKAYAWCNQNLSDPDRLQKRVFMDIYLYFGRQCRQNLPHLTKDNFGMDVDANNHRYVYFIDKAGDTTRKNNNNNSSTQLIMKERVGFANCPVKMFLKYVSKLDPHYPRFFCHQKLNVDPLYHTVWYTKQPMGEKRMAEFMKAISSDAGLSKVYTNHCLRSTLLYFMEEGELEAKDVSRLTCSQVPLEVTVNEVLTPPRALPSQHVAKSNTKTWSSHSTITSIHSRNKPSQDENSCELFTGVSSMVNSFTLNSFCEAMEADKQVSEKDMADNSSGNSTLDFKLRQSEFMEAQKQQAEFMEAQKQQAEFMEAQKQQAEFMEAQKQQAEFMEAQKQQAEFLEAQKQAEILAEERQQRLNDSKVYKYMVLNHEKKILDTLRTLWKGNQFCDATLQNECVSIPVHKILLIACCPKILDTYDYIMKDTNVQVCFPRKVSAEALRVFVDYLYSGSLNLSRSTLDSIEYLSGMLGLDDIRQLCNQFRLDLINNAANVPDKTIVSVSHSQSSSGLRLSLSNPPATPPPPIVRLSSQSTLHSSTTSTTTTTGTVQFPSSSPSHSSSSRYQGNRSYSQKVCDNRVSAFPDPGRDIVLLNSIKLEPEVDLTVDECTQVKQEVIPYQSSEQFRSWSANMDSHSDDSSSHCKTTDSHNFEVTTTVDLSETTLKPYSDNSHNTDNSHKSAGRDDLQSVISISPSNSPLHSPASLDSPPPSPPPHHIHTFDDVDSGSLPKGDSSPYPVGLVLANSYNNLTENNRKKKTTFDEDFDATEFSCKKSKITLEL
ncbi:uncharacterized protein LOC115220336 isoform X2 [Argonauta hians]